MNAVKGLVNGQASKFLVMVLTAVSAGMATYYGTAKWEPGVVMGIGAIVGYLVPNSSPISLWRVAGMRRIPLSSKLKRASPDS